MRTVITIQTPDGDMDINAVEIEGTEFAIHASLVTDKKLSDLWTVTHVPTGYALTRDMTSRQSALQVAREAKAIQWLRQPTWGTTNFTKEHVGKNEVNRLRAIVRRYMADENVY